MAVDPTLLERAISARDHAHAQYSRFRVGAALLDAEGRIWTGSNIESSSYGLSVCAERVALFKALSEGVGSFRSLAIAAEGNGAVAPCGACRQLLYDYAPDIKIHLVHPERGLEKTMTMKELYPFPFNSDTLPREDKE